LSNLQQCGISISSTSHARDATRSFRVSAHQVQFIRSCASPCRTPHAESLAPHPVSIFSKTAKSDPSIPSRGARSSCLQSPARASPVTHSAGCPISQLMAFKIVIHPFVFRLTIRAGGLRAAVIALAAPDTADGTTFS
jgi:hypothetical protein